MKKIFLITLLSFVSLMAVSQIPAGYYDGTEGLGGDALKSALNNIIKGHTTYPYTSGSTDIWDILKQTDKDPGNADNVILLYSGRSINAAQEYNDGNGWTREHVWAKSRGDLNEEVEGPGTDAHNLRPCDNDVNTARNNRWFAECNEEYIDNGFPTGSYTSSTEYVWKPRDAVKGDVARMIFYMATRYEGFDGEPDLEVIDYFPADQYTHDPVHALLSDLLLWNTQDPVDDFERNRNDVIYSFQGNRNPFVDHPEWVECIFNNNCTGFYFTTSPDTELTDRESFSYNIAATGSDNVLTITGETIPAWLTFTSTLSETGNATATLTGDPEFTDIGTHPVSLKLSDGTDDVYQNFNIIVTDGNPIAFTSTPVTYANVDQVYTYNVTATGDDGATFTLTGTTLPTWLSLSQNTVPATLSGTPSISDIGTTSIVLTLTDTKKTITQEFDIIVADPNDINTVIITQYYEGASNDKYIEITNIGDESVDLSPFYLARWGNTSAPSGAYTNGGALSGTIGAGVTQIYKNSAAATPAYAVSSAVGSTEATYFNGDDPIALTRNGSDWENRVDCIYADGTWGLDKSFYRKSTVTSGNINKSVLDGTGEWVQVSIEDVNNAANDTPEYLGFHGEDDDDNTSGIENLELLYKIYPNPAKDFINIESENQINKIEILSINGQNLKTEIINNSKAKINISELPKGIYFLNLSDSNGNISSSKFVK
ncbi:MAG: endonuclease [Bacteroidales bacterium]|nr:endonuclease [Bacteroidales bacterium]MBN2757923.1 endonuclease [Bacteroidales bacterium]